VARAVIRRPALLLADEPTGNLDPKSGEQVLDLLLDLTRTHQTGLVVVTHSEEIARRLGRSLTLADGWIAPGGLADSPFPT
jgi:predicted ABC-type transport system involved in lysophospholipase L1 biosynthesis ATPase subunit